nr:polysaccharide pyruvyl transferase family protein [uncultured Butyrivibrio sp.]
MKVSIITRHAITNYGSLLQAYATQTAIEELGHECEIVDYIRRDESYKEHEKTLLRRKIQWNNNPLKRFAYLALRQPESIFAGRRFEKERMKYLKLSQKFETRESISANCPKADVYMTGSDQVWGPTEDGTYDSNYFLSFAGESKKIAYAASFGHTDMNEELYQYFKKLLASYACIAVREKSAVDIINDMGYQASQVLDPTLLFDRHFWSKRASDIKKGKYILVYQIHNDPQLSDYAEKVAKKKGLPLIRISASFHQITRSGKFIWCPSIADFLGYIKNAELLITDSFHGTAFAINFNTPFVEVLPNNNTGTRNVSILSLTGLSDRILCSDNIGIEDKKIDFEKVNNILEVEREKSKNILQKMIVE